MSLPYQVTHILVFNRHLCRFLYIWNVEKTALRVWTMWQGAGRPARDSWADESDGWEYEMQGWLRWTGKCDWAFKTIQEVSWLPLVFPRTPPSTCFSSIFHTGFSSLSVFSAGALCVLVRCVCGRPPLHSGRFSVYENMAWFLEREIWTHTAIFITYAYLDVHSFTC